MAAGAFTGMISSKLRIAAALSFKLGQLSLTPNDLKLVTTVPVILALTFSRAKR
jgi:hypothetical protein